MGRGVGGEKNCSVKWGFCRPKIYGGLGVKGLKLGGCY